MGRYTTGGVGRDVLAGAIAGGAAVWLINKMDWSLTHSGRSGNTGAGPAHAAAAKAADAAGVTINDTQQRVAGRTVHYGVGIGVGALYGLLRGMAPSVTTGRGSLFGVATFILGDEIGAPALGLSKGPLDYPAGDHAKSALAHIGFGVATDLVTRLLSPWKSEVVIVRGPSIQERVEGGRQAIADGRAYLYDQGRYALDQGRSYAEQARDQVDEFDLPGVAKKGRKKARKLAEALRSQLPDPDDVMDVVDQGRQHVSRFASKVASRLPDPDDVSDVVERGRKRARGWARNLPDRDDVSDAAEQGRSKGRGLLRSLLDLLPARDDVEDAVGDSRKRARKLAKQAKERLPDRDGVDDAVADGRKRVRRLADDARDAGGTTFDKLSRWLFG